MLQKGLLPCKAILPLHSHRLTNGGYSGSFTWSSETGEVGYMGFTRQSESDSGFTKGSFSLV
jgi:hypothetical protein